MENKTRESKLRTNQAYLDKFKTVSVRLEPDVYNRITESANGQSINRWITDAIKARLED